jgi:hypothetical protein
MMGLAGFDVRGWAMLGGLTSRHGWGGNGCVSNLGRTRRERGGGSGSMTECPVGPVE